jgi:uridine kinase
MSHLTKEKRQSVNYDCPSAVDNELLHQHLIGLKNGNPINMPVYDFSTHTRKKKTIYVEPKDFVILEGLLILISPIILKEIDLKIYVDTPDDIRLIRRIKRDMKERNRNIDSILKQYLTSVRPMHYLHVDKEKDAADMIIKGTNINNNTIRSILAAIDNFKYFKGQVQ